jgi:UDP-glucose 4-epimerase
VKVLVTGGAGYIGSTVASACADAGLVPVVLDDLSAGVRAFTAGRALYAGDIADAALLDRVFAEHPDIGAAVHCAAVTVVPDSVARPLHYYRENVAKTVDLLDGLVRNGCTRVVFSSSAAVYASTPDLRVDEDSPLAPMSPYARTKAMVEDVLRDTAAATGLRAVALRYFNPIGADPSMRTGLQVAEPTHVLGRLTTAYRTGTPFPVTGVDWPTRDGSGMRDYVHVWDLAQAHVAALQAFDRLLPAAGTPDRPAYQVVNLGTGRGTTVRELVDAFRTVVGADVATVDAPRRDGDVIGGYASAERAAELLGWRAGRSLVDGIRDALEWDARRGEILARVP